MTYCVLYVKRRKQRRFVTNASRRYANPAKKTHVKQKKTKGHNLTDIDQVTVSILKVPCSLCNGQAERVCSDCTVRLCTACAESHHKLDINRVDGKSETIRDSSQICSICCNREVTLCTECDVHVCTKCSNGHHTLRDTLSSGKRINTNRDFEKRLGDPKEHSEESNIFKSRPSTDKTSTGSSTVDPMHGQAVEGDIPGKPDVKNIYSDSVDIVWAGVDSFCEGDVYQVRTENINQTNTWHDQNFKLNNGKVTGLEPGASYVFKVRLVKANGEGSKYRDKSEEITTPRAYASELVRTLSPVKAKRNGPNLFKLPMQENKQARNDTSLIQKYDIGPRSKEDKEKTIMLVGETGTGKSTFVDGIANYVMGVRLRDPFRFTLSDNPEKQSNQAISQTEWITTYSFNPQMGTRLKYRLNVIDTPGFGDTRGLKRDHKLVDQIRHLFEATGEKGVQTIDSVCFIIKAPDSRLTATQIYIFNAIMSLFGKDIEENICTLITFADGSEPPVLFAVNESGLPFGKTFTFNNSALFSNPSNSFTSTYWKMGLQNFEAVITHISMLETKSMQLTKEVLQERRRLELTVINLQKKIKEGLLKTDCLNSEVRIFQNNQEEIARNANFNYEVVEEKVVLVNLPVGIHVTNCMICNRTCHYNCRIPDDDMKMNCSAMDSYGYCEQCPYKCKWNLHKNHHYKYDVVPKIVQKTYEGMKKKYEEALGKEMSHKEVLIAMKQELENLTLEIESMVDKMRTCTNRLKEIALRPNPLGMVAQIDILIQAEKHEGKSGYLKRIEILQQIRERAEIGQSINKFRQETGSVLNIIS